MLASMGIETGIDVDHLIEVARSLERTLGARLPGKVHAIQASATGTVSA